MTIHREGFVSILLVLLVSAILICTAHYGFPGNVYVGFVAYAISIFLTIVILQFFRNPIFSIPTDASKLLCPADGKVVVIEEVEEPEYFKDKRLQVSIFMSPINVHVNRNPMGGTVSYAKYHPGKFLVAWHPKSSTENERTSIAVKNDNGMEILYRQIAGALARRICYYVKAGDQVAQGSEFGFIKFGSRVDIFLPVGTKVDVTIGQVVKGGRTSLATIA